MILQSFQMQIVHFFYIITIIILEITVKKETTSHVTKRFIFRNIIIILLSHPSLYHCILFMCCDEFMYYNDNSKILFIYWVANHFVILICFVETWFGKIWQCNELKCRSIFHQRQMCTIWRIEYKLYTKKTFVSFV